jgi:hypothetical protein
MPVRLYRTLALPAALRFDATPEGLSRVRAFLLAAIVIVVPGAWLVALLWLAVRRARAQSL